MPPYIIPLTIEYPSGTALSSVQVTLRNQSTDELQTGTTDANGQVVFDCSNFASGFVVGDVVEWSVSYSAYEGSDSHTITSGGGMSADTLVLTAYPALPALRYFAPKDLFLYLDMEPYSTSNTEGIKSRRISLVGEGVEADIDSDCNTRFDSSNSVSAEYHDVDNSFQKDFYLKKGPVQSVTTVEVNTADEDQTASWQSLTENTDFEVDLATGRVRLTSSDYFPGVGSKQLRVTYTYGYSSVPRDIKHLAIMEVARALFGGVFAGQRIRGVDVSALDDADFVKYRERVINKYRFGLVQNT